MSEPFRLTEAEVRTSLAALAVDLDRIRGEALKLQAGLLEQWPSRMFQGEVPPSLRFWLYQRIETALVSYLGPGLEELQRAVAGTEDVIRREWDRQSTATGDRA